MYMHMYMRMYMWRQVAAQGGRLGKAYREEVAAVGGIGE
jgi:hypothetical protein